MLSFLSLLFFIPITFTLGPPVRISKSPITLPIAVRINASGSKIIEADRARARHLLKVAQDILAKQGQAVLSPNVGGGGAPLTNAGVTYTANVGIGNPPTQYNLIVDTGSSNTWVGAGTPYAQTSTSTATGECVSINYGSGSFSGAEFLDRLTLSPCLVVNNQGLGVASTSTGFQGVDGILGLGPTALTAGAFCSCPGCEIPTVTDNLFAQGTINSKVIGISFEPTTTSSSTNGEITFGLLDPAKFTGPITFTPITKTNPSSLFWGIDQAVNYGGSALPILFPTAGIVDSGTTLVLLATDAFQRYEATTGGVLDVSTGLLSITSAQFMSLQGLFFVVQNTVFELTPNAQIWPRSLNTLIGGTPSGIYLIVGDIGTPSGQGLDFINGYVFLERFYSVFDGTNNQVGFATTSFTGATTN